MRKQKLLFSESYIMDSTTVAPSLQSLEEERRSRGGGGGGRGEEKEKGEGHPSLIRSPSLDRDSC